MSELYDILPDELDLALEGFIARITQFGREEIVSDEIAGKGKRFVVEASDDIGGWGVRIWEPKHEHGRGDVRHIRYHAKLPDRRSAVDALRKVAANVRQQVK